MDRTPSEWPLDCEPRPAVKMVTKRGRWLHKRENSCGMGRHGDIKVLARVFSKKKTGPI